MATVRFMGLARLPSSLAERIANFETWRTIGRLAALALAAVVLVACAQSSPALLAVTPEAGTAVAAPTPAAEASETLAGMKQFADGESNFAFSIPVEWDVFGPDHNAIGSQWIMGPTGTGWTSGEPAAVQISVIDMAAMMVSEALEMLCQGCQILPEPQATTLANGLPALRAAGVTAEGGAAEFTIIELGPKAIIFVVDEARAGTDADTLLATFGPLDGEKAAGENTGRFLYEGIRFRLPGPVAGWASGESIAAVEGGPDAPWWEAAPKHSAITLVGYMVEGSVQTPRILVYPVEELAAANAEAAGRIELLRELLETQAVEPGTQLPILPLTNAGGPLQAQVKFLAFEGGQGVRYLAQHGQGPAPINHEELFYTFQGLTDDGAHYVAAILPVTHPSLPARVENLAESEWRALLDNFTQYIEDATTALETQPDESFTPSLAELDALVRSISVLH